MGAGAVVAVAIIVMSGCGGYVAVNQGYVPVKDLMGTGLTTLSVVAPPGNYTIVTKEQIRQQYPEIAARVATQMPHYNEILVGMYVANDSLELIGAYYNTYLFSRGYACEASGNLIVGDVEPLGKIPIFYYGYTKGITAVGIVMSDAIPGKTLVLYTTGYAQYYNDIISWLQGQKIALGS